MGTATLILGESGTGKSTSLRNIDPKQSILIKPIGKPLPFKSKEWTPWDKDKKSGTVVTSDRWDLLVEVIKRAHGYGKRIVIVDDFQYVMSNEFMRRSEEKSFDKFTEIGRHAWEVIKAAQDAPDDLRVYFLAHTEETQMGRVKMKTIGKMLDEKITVEGMFTIVLRTLTRDEQFFFTTKNNGNDTVKSPMGMFDTNEIDNDLAFVDSTILQLLRHHQRDINKRKCSMSNVIFTYNEESALTAGQGGFINETGAYVITITDALLITSSGGANAIEFSGESDDGRKVQYLSVYTTKKDKSVNTFGANMIHAIMGCTGVKQITQYMKSAGVYVAPEFSGKRVGLVLQKVISNKPDGSPTYKLDIRIPFIADTRQTLQERHKGKNAETIDKMIATLKDKDERNKSTGNDAGYHHRQDDEDFNPF